MRALRKWIDTTKHPTGGSISILEESPVVTFELSQHAAWFPIRTLQILPAGARLCVAPSSTSSHTFVESPWKKKKMTKSVCWCFIVLLRVLNFSEIPWDSWQFAALTILPNDDDFLHVGACLRSVGTTSSLFSRERQRESSEQRGTPSGSFVRATCQRSPWEDDPTLYIQQRATGRKAGDERFSAPEKKNLIGRDG